METFMIKTMTIKEQAYAYIVNGKSVIPLGKDKRPLLSSWKEFQSRYATFEEIEQWFSKYPEANIGIVCGEISQLSVIDIDDPLSIPLSTFPSSYTVETPSKGYHIFYKYNKNIQTGANTFAQYPKVDYRNDGSYVVASPSHCVYTKGDKKIDGVYRVINNIEPIPFPINLFPHSTHTQYKKHDPKLAFGSPEGRRNQSTAEVIGHILSRIHPNYWLDFGLGGLREWNKRNNPPLDDKELVATFNSIASRQYARHK